MSIISSPSPFMLGISNFNNLYSLPVNNVNSLLDFLLTSTFLDDLDLLMTEPTDYITSLRIYPFNVKKYTHPEDETLITADSNIVLGNVDTSIKGNKIGNYKPYFLNVGSLNISRYYNNFLDFSPYTKIKLYLPYIDYVELTPELVYNKNIQIRYAIDYSSGSCTAFLYNIDEDIIVGEYNGQIGYDVPIGSGITNESIRDGIKMVTSVIAGGASLFALGTINTPLGLASAIGMSANISSKISNVVKPPTSIGTHPTSKTAFYAPQSPFLLINRPIVQKPENYNHNFGVPSGKSAVINTLTGYTVVDSIHLEDLNTCTLNEAEEIEKLLKSGVIL